MRKSTIIGIVLTILLIASIAGLIVYALTSFSGSANWSGLGNKMFDVYLDQNGGTALTTPYNLTGLIVGENIKNFWIQNTGDVTITVSVSEGTENNCTATWSPTFVVVPIGNTRQQMTLNLTVTDSSGSYSWTFGVS